MTALRVPVATYRLQFNRSFRFEHARALVPYLHKLGVTDLYASPLFRARPGSGHGYDVTDPTRLNPELGTHEEFEALDQELKQFGMGLLLDIVPNHMAASPENPWWMDFLENGPSSPYAAFFEIVWHPTTARGVMEDKVLIPILGGPYGSVLENQEITLTLEESGFFVWYYEVKLPIDPKSYGRILTHRLGGLEQAIGADHPALQGFLRLVDAVEQLPDRTATGPEEIEVRRRDGGVIKRQLWHLYNAHPEIHQFLDDNVRIFNGTKGDPSSFDLLDALLADQAYWLAFWRVVTEKINYRRFFDISDLIGIRVQDPRVFEATHALVLRLAKEGKVTGLRIDHIDGLFDPLEYLRRLQGRIVPGVKGPGGPPSFYVLVEKILIGDEPLPEEWPVCGTTGYDFLNAMNELFVDQQGLKTLDAIYARFTGTQMTFKDVVYQQKKRVVEELFAGELRALGHHLGLLAEQYRHARYLSPKELMQALVEITACLPVYRTYIRGFEVPARDRPYIERTVEDARHRNPEVSTSVFNFLKRVLLLDLPTSLGVGEREAWLLFVMHWQQFAGPVMAKGLEDTACYIYNRLISLNEVGGDPEAQQLSVEAFHRYNGATRVRRPYTLNATSTHDTKRSEDVRARINVLAELPQAWARCLSRWSQWNRSKKRKVDGRPVPDPNEEMLLYQTLLGAWPLVEAEVPAFRERVKGYLIKAAREAKVHTSWINPQPGHESVLVAFVDAILRPSHRNKFLTDFLRSQGKIAFYGACNSLAQVLLKITAPGVPDLYQGTELWDFSLVDPDNRRPVDFGIRARLLEDLKRRETKDPLALVSDLLARWADGRIKLFVTAKALNFRATHSELFLKGNYLPLYARGKWKERVCAFARRSEEAWAVVAVPRLLTKLIKAGVFPLGGRVWGNGCLVLPEEAPGYWLNVLTDEAMEVSFAMGRKILPLKSIFRRFPVALLSGIST
ncbi:MAG TPA: malto-oligosyltrehalose synthase [Candidatus Methylomirabilis sp.]|nr:malto-oligosyltrehalose synthase [Candidatus Methylomirabilis sp.]